MTTFRPAEPFNVAAKLLIPTISKAQGVTVKKYPTPESVLKVLFCSFKTFGGTESTSNDVYTLIDTATINCWYDPQITADCRIYICETGETYEIAGRPENVNMQHKYMQLKVKKVGGKA